MKKRIALFLSALLVVSLLGSCGATAQPSKAPAPAGTQEASPAGGSDEGFVGYDLPITTEPVTLRIAASKRADYGDFGTLPFFQMVEEKTGVKIEWEIYEREVGWPENRGLMMAGNDYPDCFYGAAGFVASDMVAYGETGKFLALNSLIDKYASNLQNIFEKRPDIKTYITAPDGNIYHIPIVDESGIILGSTPFINTDWLTETGLDMPTNADEMLNVLRAMKAKGHNTPFGFQDLGGNTGFLQFSCLFGLNVFEPDEYCVKNGSIVFGPAEVEFKETLKFLNTIYSEGLMDVESLTQDRATYQAKARQTPPAYGIFPAWSRSWMLGAADHENFESYALIPPMKNTDGKVMWNYQNAGIGNSGFIITDKCKYPEIAMSWIDFCADVDISIQATGGLYGEYYEVQQNNNLKPIDPPEGISGSDWIAHFSPGVSGFRIILAEDAKRILPGKDATERQNTFEIYRKENAFNYPLYNVPYYLSEDIAETIDLIQVDMDDYVEETIGRWIVNGNIDAEWDGYVAQLKTYGLQTVLDVYNGFYKK